MSGIEASRRVAWAKYYDTEEYAEWLEDAVHDLIDAVLVGGCAGDRKCEAFSLAWALRYSIEYRKREN